MRLLLRFFVTLLVLAGIVAIAIWQCPASLVLPYLWTSESVQLSGIAGTIWNGRAERLAWHNQFLGQVAWQLHLRPLLANRRRADFLLTGDGLSVKGSIDKFAGDTDFHALSFRAPAALAARFAGVADLAASGEVEGTIPHLAIHRGEMTDVQADASWHNAAVTAPQAVDFGEAHIRFASTSPGNVAGDVQTVRGSTRFAGSFATKGSLAESEWHDLQFHLPASTLLLPLHVSDIALTGDVDGTIPLLQLHAYLPIDIQGRLVWHDAATAGGVQANFGDVDATFTKSADGSISALVNASNGALEAGGTFKILRTQPGIEADWHDVHFRFPAQLATPVIHSPGILPTGEVAGTISDMQWRDHWPKQLQGKLDWRKAGISAAKQAAFGDIEVTYGAESDSSIIGSMNDSGADALKVEGTFKLTPDTYSIEMILSARNGDAQAVDAVHRVGTLQPDGSSLLKKQGSTAALFATQ